MWEVGIRRSSCQPCCCSSPIPLGVLANHQRTAPGNHDPSVFSATTLARREANIPKEYFLGPPQPCLYQPRSAVCRTGWESHVRVVCLARPVRVVSAPRHVSRALPKSLDRSDPYRRCQRRGAVAARRSRGGLHRDPKRDLLGCAMWADHRRRRQHQLARLDPSPRVSGNRSGLCDRGLVKRNAAARRLSRAWRTGRESRSLIGRS